MRESIQKANPTIPPWSEAEVRLRAEREEVTVLLAEAEPQSVDQLAGEWQERDSPSEDEIREVEYSRRQALHRRLRQIDEAIGRISQGAYGRCARCGKQIAPKRLAADRAAALCLNCQAASEGDHLPPSL